jgi:hypothetical protein
LVETDDLFTIAEIAVALAGFSAVIGVLGSRADRSDAQVDALRLQAMLESSLMVAFFALVPVLVTRFGVGTPSSWRISSVLFLLFAIPLEFLALSRTKNMRDMTLARFNINTVNWCLSLGADLIMLVVLLGLVGSHAGAFYLLAILALLTMSGLLFIQFAASTFVPRDQ